jgi:hypothetical protein
MNKGVNKLRAGFIMFLLWLILAGVVGDNSLSLTNDAHAADMQGQGVQIDISIEGVTLNPRVVKRGDEVTFTITLKNYGEITEDYILLRLYDGKNLLTDKMIFPEEEWGVKNMAEHDLVWNTSNVPPGKYHVKVEAFMYSDMDEFDNEYVVPGEISVLN